jgi:hypothetical protein
LDQHPAHTPGGAEDRNIEDCAHENPVDCAIAAKRSVIKRCVVTPQICAVRCEGRPETTFSRFFLSVYFYKTISRRFTAKNKIR